MTTTLARQWFLLVLLAGIIMTLWQPTLIQPFVSPLPTRLVVAAILLLISWSLDSHQLWQSITRPYPALWAVSISYGLLPLLGWLGSYCFWQWNLVDFSIGLAISTSLPCTLASAAIWTRLAKGNEATALLVTFITTCTSWLVTTLWLKVTTGTYIDMSFFGMMRDLLLYLVVPVALGQLARYPIPLRRVAIKQKKMLSILTRLLILSIILKAIVQANDHFQHTASQLSVWLLLVVAAVCIAIHFISLLAGYWSSVFFGFQRGDCIAVAFACSQKTLPVGLLLLNTYFSQYALAVIPMLFYHIGQLVLDTFIADWWRNGQPAAETQPVDT